MCGIAGLWYSGGAAGDSASWTLAAMIERLVHRGPDDHGVWSDPDAGVFLGHRRLSIIDLSPLGHQPMVTDDGQLVVVFNGEIYNFQELRRDLEARGASFVSKSDTEVLLLGYREWGAKVVDRLVGMFAFAIWDVRKNELFLARDRAGEKPLYYAMAPWGFAFASELSALADVPGLVTELDPDAIALYLHYQYVPAPHSIYRGIRKLSPGHAMRVSGGQAVSWRYWDPVAIAQQPRLDISESDAVAELTTLLTTAVRGQMIADVPLGAFLSGGIDSTAIVSLMVEVAPSSVRTFTIGFDVPQWDESSHASAVARHLGTEHVVEYLTERDALELIPRLPSMYGEPFADSSALPTHLLSVTARKHVTVSLSGDGGDEAFGGYRQYDYIDRILSASRAAGPFAPLAGRILSRAPGRIGRGGRLLALPAEEVHRQLIRVFLRADDAPSLAGPIPPLPEFKRAWESLEKLSPRRRAMVADLLTYMPEAILVKVDRAAMATSLETRAPILDHRVLEFSLRLPARLLHHKHVLRQLVYQRVPRAIVDRPKQGFGVPLSRWFRGELREPLLDILTPEQLDAVGLRDYGVVKRLLDEHMAGTADNSSGLWALLVLALWDNDRRERVNREPAPTLMPAV
jgi:asparagine synthase (glutamine-hydrolysing)